MPQPAMRVHGQRRPLLLALAAMLLLRSVADARVLVQADTEGESLRASEPPRL